jgi:hypothetical protein
MFERRHLPLASPEVFKRRLITSGGVGLVMIAISLAVGIAGYMGLEGLGAIDAFVNAAMILSGMGPLHNPETTGGKIFAGCYAIYCGFAVLAIAAIMFTPLVHRLMHRFHLEEMAEADEAQPKKSPPAK